MHSRITLRVRKLLLLIPTDPEVQDALDNFVPKESSVWSHQVPKDDSQIFIHLLAEGLLR